MSLNEYEGPEGEAAVRHLIETLPQIEPDVPKVFTVVKGPKLQSTSMDFIARLADTKLSFVSGEVLTMREPDKSIVDPRSGLSPVTLQIAELQRTGPDRWEAVAGWAYKKVFERRKLTLVRATEGYQVTEDIRLDGNHTDIGGTVPSGQ